MLAIDLQTRKRNRKRKALENVTNVYLEDAAVAEQQSPRFNNQ
jgi:hypothetical protein